MAVKAVFENGNQSAIYFPLCKPLVKLVVKTNRKNGNQFLGCPNWPECDHTRKIPESWIMEANGQPTLF